MAIWDSIRAGHPIRCVSFNRIAATNWVRYADEYHSLCAAADGSNQMSVKTLEVDTIKEGSQSMTNSVTSFGSGYTQTTARNRRRGVIEVDPNADILRLNIRVACCAIILLQEVSPTMNMSP